MVHGGGSSTGCWAQIPCKLVHYGSRSVVWVSITRSVGGANSWGVERAEAEAVYDAGREACVEFLMSLMAAHERLEERVRVLEAKGAASSRNSSVAPSADTAISRQERRVLARATKELLKKDGQRRKAGGQPGHRGAGRGLLAEDQMKESATITRASARAADTSSRRLRRSRGGVRGAIKSPSCPRSLLSTSSIAPTGCAARGVRRGPVAPWAWLASQRSGRSCRRRW